jgi:hypothetical protein
MKPERVRFYAGLDGYMLLRYIKLCKRVCLVSGLGGICVLVPMYIHGDKLSDHWTAEYIVQNPSAISLVSKGKGLCCYRRGPAATLCA